MTILKMFSNIKTGAHKRKKDESYYSNFAKNLKRMDAKAASPHLIIFKPNAFPNHT